MGVPLGLGVYIYIYLLLKEERESNYLFLLGFLTAMLKLDKNTVDFAGLSRIRSRLTLTVEVGHNENTLPNIHVHRRLYCVRYI
jgi:hypothetical protein